MAPTADAPAPEMASLSLAASGAPKGTAKRDALCAAEVEVQALWEREKAFECNPSYGPDGEKEEKFIVTFPYPYSNGHLHLGHAFSLTKSVFRAQFERNRGKNSLFPFAFHCTGMPIQAVSLAPLSVCLGCRRCREVSGEICWSEARGSDHGHDAHPTMNATPRAQLVVSSK